MRDEEIEGLYQKKLEEEKKEKELEKRVEKLTEIKHFLVSPKGFWENKCPKCGARLNIKWIDNIRYFKCPTVSCDYEYARYYIPHYPV